MFKPFLTILEKDKIQNVTFLVQVPTPSQTIADMAEYIKTKALLNLLKKKELSTMPLDQRPENWRDLYKEIQIGNFSLI